MNVFNGAVTVDMPTAAGTLNSRADFTRYHILAAHNAFQSATDIESKHEHTNQVEIINMYIAHISTCIMCCVAALESELNKYIFDYSIQIDTYQIHKEPSILNKYDHIKDGALSMQLFENTSFIFKFDVLWFLAHKHLMPENNLTQNMRYLSLLRNALTHFTPEWADDLKKHKKLINCYKNRFSLNPYYPQKETMFFPYRCLSAACAGWSIRVCEESLRLLPNLHL